MGNYIVSARKYRPSSFDSVVGQQALTLTLKNAIAQGKLAHAYLFCGPRGVGKTTCARIFAKTINCLSPTESGDACNACESCLAFNEQRSYNIHELDAASNNSVEDIRELIEQTQIPPQIGRYKVFIIDEVHMLSQAAFNAFLKTLEEPPAHAVFILATTEKHKILPTILSRCQIYDFARMRVADIVAHLQYVADKEGYVCEREALQVIAEKADGGMRDALSIFDQVVSYCEGNITYEKVIEDLNVLDYDVYFAITDHLLKCDIPSVMVQFDQILSKGFEANYFIGGLASHFRNLLMSRDAQTLPLLEVSDRVRQRYHEQAQQCRVKFLYNALRLCNDCDINYRAARNKRLLVELTLIEVGQAAVSDDDAGCGRRPTRRLKPLFTPEVPAAAAASRQAVTTPSVPASTVVQPSVSVAQQPVPLVPATSAAQPASGAPSNLMEQLAQAGKHQAGHRRLKPARTLSIRSSHPLSDVATPAAGATVAPSEQSQATQQAVQPMANPFNQDSLVYYWHRFANQLPREQSGIAGRMRNMDPKLATGWCVEVVVENEMVEHYMLEVKVSLQNYLRTQLKNDLITLKLIIAANDAPHRAYSRLEQFTEMLEGSKELRYLQQALELELA